MKVALLKLGGHFEESSTSIAIGEVKSIYILLSKIKQISKLDIFTVLSKKQEESRRPKQMSLFTRKKEIEYTIRSLDKEFDSLVNDYDVLVVVNGSANFFGGTEDTAILMTYRAIRDFKGKVFYFLTDPALMLKQLSIASKPWADKYRDEDYLFIQRKIDYICQANNLDHVKLLTERDSYVSTDSICHFPFEKFTYVYNKPLRFNPDPPKDLIYGGTFRSGAREKSLINYYFGYENVNVELFGKLKLEDFNENKVGSLSKPNFAGFVPYDRFIRYMNEEAMSTVLIGDEVYIDCEDIAQRVYESILASVVCFVDIRYDQNKNIFKNETLREFNYVSSRDDVEKKINYLKNNLQFRENIVKLQYEDTKIDIDGYCSSLYDILNGEG